MKKLSDLFELVTVAVERNNTYSEDWFIEYSGHVNKLSIKRYLCGWRMESDHHERAEFYLTEEGIQGAYWFIKTKI